MNNPFAEREGHTHPYFPSLRGFGLCKGLSGGVVVSVRGGGGGYKIGDKGGVE